MEYKYVLFDLDGCLIDTLNLWLKSLRRLLKQYGVEVSDEKIIKTCIGVGDGPKKLGVKEDMRVFWDLVVSDVHHEYANAPLFPGVKETLETLHQRGFAMALVSTSVRESVTIALTKHGLAKYFKAVVARDDTPYLKPHPAPIELAISKLHAKKESTLVVGDSPHDVGAAKAVGLHSVIYYPKENSAFYEYEQLLNYEPTFLVEHFPDLLDIIN